MKLSFKDVTGRHRDKPAIAVGHGPSLNIHLKDLAEYERQGHVLVGCNEWYRIYNAPPRYWVLSNNIQTISTDHGIMNRHKGNTTVVYADSIDLTDSNWVERTLQCDYLPYDQRHFSCHPCGCKPCPCERIIIPGRLTIQEELAKYCGLKKNYGGDSVLLNCISLSVLMGCNPIYVLGMDLDYRLGYAQNTGNLISKVQLHELGKYKDRILHSLRIIVDLARKVGTTIKAPSKLLCFGIMELGEPGK